MNCDLYIVPRISDLRVSDQGPGRRRTLLKIFTFKSPGCRLDNSVFETLHSGPLDTESFGGALRLQFQTLVDVSSRVFCCPTLLLTLSP